jgi:pimeloyl-ACP methyl ester carboxylesterase
LISYRSYGSAVDIAVVLHGGPAAVGNAKELAEGLSGLFRTIEPWQRGSGPDPLSVQQHIDDLDELIETFSENGKPILIGESWGAMLALAYAAHAPETISRLVIVGCGTFDPESGSQLQRTIAERTDEELRTRLDQIRKENGGTRDLAAAMSPIYDFDRVHRKPDPEIPPFDEIAFRQTWDDMVRLQDEGVYPVSFSAIQVPVLMLHGDYDPHPGRMIRDSLLPYIPDLEYVALANCGHSTWLERQARDAFFLTLSTWLEKGA